MMNSTISSFFGVSVLMALMPGPDNLFLLTLSTLKGRKAGLYLAAGLCSGLLFHTLAVALGVATLLKAYPMAFTVIKICGASYLVYLAWMSFNSSSSTADDGDVNLEKVHKLFYRGVFMNITNPKVSIFFLAFLPQFVIPSAGAVGWQLVNLGLIFMLAAAMVFSCISVLAGTIGNRFLRSPQVVTMLNKVGGIVFLLLAVKIII